MDPPSNATQDDDQDAVGGKRIFGIIPNYRTAPDFQSSEPIGAKEKFKLATQDSMDRGALIIAAIFAAKAQWSNSNPSFGPGLKGYGHNLGAALLDNTIGDYMTEAVYPSLLHQDPRYFRHGPGSGLSRLGYAMGQIFWTHTDARGSQFNYSEVLGNATAAAIATSYYPDGRDAGDVISKFGIQLGVDMGGNILKEFWPDIQRKFLHRNTPGEP